MTNRYPYHYFLLPCLGAALGACLSAGAPVDEEAMCQSSADCVNTEVCDVGVCWGDPPDTSAFAAVLIPPADRPDLAPTELTGIAIASDGQISGLEFGKTVTLHGRIVLGCADGADGSDTSCGDEALVPAQVIVERAASFEGGPQYRRTALTNTEAALEEDSFSISLPADGAEYRVTVVPDEANLEALNAGGSQIQAPPFSTTIRADADVPVLWEIGKPEQLKTITGCITSATGNGTNFEGMHVQALGRWTTLSKPTRASSIVTTDQEGCYSLSVPIDMLDEFDILAKPGPGRTLPTMRLSGEYVRDPAPEEPLAVHTVAPLLMPNAANPTTFKLPLEGLSGAGASEPVSGATVILDTTFELPVPDERDIKVSFSAQAVSNALGEAEPGVAVVELYPGSIDINRTYRVRVFSPPDSEYASTFDATVDVGTGEGAPVLSNLELERRVAVTGMFTTSDEQPLAGTPLSVRPSPGLRLEVDPLERTILDNLQFPSALTGETGEFLLWLDQELLGLMARYDFELAPPDFSSAPRWAFEDIPLENPASSVSSVDFGLMALPAASYARGEVRDTEGRLVVGAEVRWFRLPEPGSCLDRNCPTPARLLGIWESNESGEVVAVLPDP